MFQFGRSGVRPAQSTVLKIDEAYYHFLLLSSRFKDRGAMRGLNYFTILECGYFFRYLYIRLILGSAFHYFSYF